MLPRRPSVVQHAWRGDRARRPPRTFTPRRPRPHARTARASTGATRRRGARGRARDGLRALARVIALRHGAPREPRARAAAARSGQGLRPRRAARARARRVARRLAAAQAAAPLKRVTVGRSLAGATRPRATAAATRAYSSNSKYFNHDVDSVNILPGDSGCLPLFCPGKSG